MLNKIDVPEGRDLADLVRPDLEARGFAVYEVSAATTEGLRELGFAMAGLVAQARAVQPEPKPAQPVIRPVAVSGPEFEIRKTPEGAYFIRGDKPRRWVRQTDFTNEEAVGYLGDRLARLGVEEALAAAGAQPGTRSSSVRMTTRSSSTGTRPTGRGRPRGRPPRHRPPSAMMTKPVAGTGQANRRRA